MSEQGDKETLQEDYETVINQLEDMVSEMYLYRDLFFEKYSYDQASERYAKVEEMMKDLIDKFDEIDENLLPSPVRAKFLYLKGRTFNVNLKYDSRASQCLSKAVKLNPRLVSAWTELGECYWKNLNVKDARNSFEGALKNERSKVALRCLSIILRQEATAKPGEADYKQSIQDSVDYAKEAVALDCKDGVSWCILANAYLCQYFMVAQHPSTLKACLVAYRHADSDAIARGQPDLFYNRGIALKYDEQYAEALQNFDRACKIDPTWTIAADEMKRLITYVNQVHELIKTKGKIKTKKIKQMVESMDEKMLGPFGSPDVTHSIGDRKNIRIDRCRLDELKEGFNAGKVAWGRVIGSIHSSIHVPFTFAVVDESMTCVSVTVYNWADGRGVIIGDMVTIPEPKLSAQQCIGPGFDFNFKSIRVNNPMRLLVNGKKIGKDQIAGTRITSRYEMTH